MSANVPAPIVITAAELNYFFNTMLWLDGIFAHPQACRTRIPMRRPTELAAPHIAQLAMYRTNEERYTI
jgi:hypothetical protein